MTEHIPWFDAPDALAQIPIRARDDVALAEPADLARTFIVEGVATIPALIDSAHCDAVSAAFDQFVAEHPEYAAQHADGTGRHLRFVNLHLVCPEALRMGNAPRLARILDFLFGAPTGIYTSLFFEFGSEQPMHRDSPFFHTYPKNQFVGCWVALEDIHPDAGPLMYAPGGHRFVVDQRALFERVVRDHPDQSRDWCIRQAVEVYYGTIIQGAGAFGTPRTLPVRKGDAVIWHPELPHGGAPARDPQRTRKSIVFHCAPIGVQVHQHEAFFTADAAPPARYGYGGFGDRQYALAGASGFQVPA
ncbi:MAG: phytanoyl-CoA dioxygenase family protein [Casimicrobiaceae bacterium]